MRPPAKVMLSVICLAVVAGASLLGHGFEPSAAGAADSYYAMSSASAHRAEVQRSSDAMYDSMVRDQQYRMEEEAQRRSFEAPVERDYQPPVEDTPGRRIIRAAINGDAESQFIVSVAYFRGDAGAPDPENGMLWLRKSAENGFPEAQMTLASILVQGVEAPLDKEEAFYWASRAAKQGFVPAYMMLGMMYENGDGVAQDIDQARSYYQQAVDGGFAPAQEKLDALGG